jgi:hypothetical protein
VDDGGRLDPVPAEPHPSAGRPHRRVSRLRQIAMIVVFDLGGPLLAYAVLRSAGASAVAALVLSGVFPALGIGIGALVDRRLDVLGVMVLAGLLVATVLGLVSHDARLYLLEGSVPSVVFALGCLLSLRLQRPLIFRLAAELLGPDTPKGRDVAAAWRYPGFRRAFRTITLAWGRLPGRSGDPGRGRGYHVDGVRAALLQADSLRLRHLPVGVDAVLWRAREEEGRAPGRRS